MTMPRLGLALIAGCYWLGGCAASPSGENAASDTQRPAIEDTGDAEGLCEGRPVEVLEEYWEDGSPKIREEVVMGDDGEYILHGTTTHWWQDGQKKMELSFNCGLRHGPKRTWWPNGEPWAVGHTVNGKDHGTWTVWHQDGEKEREFHLDHGVWDGPFTVWHPNGQKKLEFEFVRGLQQGRLTMWDEHGNVVKGVDFVDGQEQPMPGS